MTSKRIGLIAAYTICVLALGFAMGRLTTEEKPPATRVLQAPAETFHDSGSRQKGEKGKSHRHTESAVINLAGGHLFRTQKVRDEFVQNLADVCNNLRSRSNCSDLHQHAKVTNYE